MCRQQAIDSIGAGRWSRWMNRMALDSTRIMLLEYLVTDRFVHNVSYCREWVVGCTSMCIPMIRLVVVRVRDVLCVFVVCGGVYINIL